MSAPSLEALVDKASARWEQVAGIPEANLFRLAILRDLMREVHAARSACMAVGNRELAQTFKGIEARTEELRTAANLDGSLQDLLGSKEKPRKRTRLIPNALYSSLPREKFERFDRVWETELVAEAIGRGWALWAMTAWVEISRAESFHQELSERLSPHGVVLFAESAGDETSASAAPGAPENLWNGRWIVVIKAVYRSPDFKVREIPGVSMEPTAPAWKLLFLPRKA